MINNKTVSSILLIAGNSTRFNENSSSNNKNLQTINNTPIFLYSLEVFIKNPYIDDIFIVVKESDKESISSIINSLAITKSISLVIGGSSRQESVYNALEESTSDIVVIHDGARPMINQEYINNSLLELENYMGTTLAVKSKDTIKISDDNGIVLETTKRENTWIIQTPQCFDREILLTTHRQNLNSFDITDDCMLLENMGYKVKLIEGDYTNIKITTKEDLNIAKELLSLTNNS